MSNGIKVKKRNGSIEPLLLDKMHLMVEEACKGLSGVSASQVEMTSGIQFYDGITTGDIQEILIKSASDLIDLDHPNYQFVAARLLLFAVRKNLYGRRHKLPNLIDHIQEKAYNDVYDKEIFDKYSQEEIKKVDGYLDHGRDFQCPADEHREPGYISPPTVGDGKSHRMERPPKKSVPQPGQNHIENSSG